MTDELIRRNKEVLFEEISINLNNISEFINQAIGMQPHENPSIDAAMLRNVLIGISNSLGFAIAAINQYYIFESGEIPEGERPMGFMGLNEELRKDCNCKK
jgi:hypothetical protein